MSKLIRLLARSGAMLTNPFYPAHGYQRPHRGDARADFTRVSGDMRTIGADLRKVADKELARNVGK